MNDYFKRPFPFIERKIDRFIASFCCAVFTFFFLLVFQPFGISFIEVNKAWYVLAYSIITFLSLLIGTLLVPALFSNYFDFENWTIKKNTLYVILQFVLIAICNWILNVGIGDKIIEQHSLIFFFFISFSVGITPILILLYFVEKKLTKKNHLFALTVFNKLKDFSNESSQVQVDLLSRNNNDSLCILLDDLLCIKSEGNYLKVFYKKEDAIVSDLIRNSLNKVITDLSVHQGVIKCHRSFIVNLSNVISISGNAKYLTLNIDKLAFSIPVSRSIAKNKLEIFLANDSHS